MSFKIEPSVLVTYHSFALPTAVSFRFQLSILRDMQLLFIRCLVACRIISLGNIFDRVDCATVAQVAAQQVEVGDSNQGAER